MVRSESKKSPPLTIMHFAFENDEILLVLSSLIYYFFWDWGAWIPLAMSRSHTWVSSSVHYCFLILLEGERRNRHSGENVHHLEGLHVSVRESSHRIVLVHMK